MEKSKRELILNAALEMFVNEGFENSPTAQIAKNAGVATGTLFHYFKTKEILINELYINIKIGMVSAIEKNLDEMKTIRQKIKCIWENIISWALKNPGGNKFFAMFGTSSYISDNTKAEGIKQFDFIIETFTKGIEEEILKNIPLELMMDSSAGLINGKITYFLKHKEEFQNEEFKAKAFSLYWDAIKR